VCKVIFNLNEKIVKEMVVNGKASVIMEKTNMKNKSG